MDSDDTLLRVQDLIDTFSPRIVAAGGVSGLPNVIESVTVSELEEPIPWMGPGGFLLTSGMTLRKEPAEGARLIRELHASGKAGLGLAMAPYWTEVPDTMIAAADELQFPLLRLSGGLPFHVVLRWAYGILSSADLYALQRTVSIQQALTELLAQGRRPEDIGRRLSDLLGADILLYDWRGGVKVHIAGGTIPGGQGDPRLAWELYASSRGAVPSPTLVRHDGLDVHLHEVRLHGGLEWVLVAMVPTREGATVFVERAMTFARALLEIQVLAERSAIGRLQRARASLLDELLLGHGEASELSERLAHHGIVGVEPWRFLVLAVGPLLPRADSALSGPAQLLRDKGAELVDAYLDSLNAHFVSGWESDCLAILIGMKMGDQPIDVDEFARGLVQQVAHSLHVRGLRAGMSETAVGVEPVVETYTHARQALMSSANAGDQTASVVRYEDLGLHYAALNALPEEHLLALRDRFVGPMLGDECRDSGQLYETLLTYLAHDRSLVDTAGALFIHRNTLVRRLARIERLLAIDLHDTDDLTQLRMALYAADILTVREKLHIGRGGQR